LPALSTVHNSWWQGVEYNPAAGLLAAAQPAEHPVPHTTHTHTHTRAADILLGYHSEEGWTAFLRLFSGHYGLEAEVGPGHKRGASRGIRMAGLRSEMPCPGPVRRQGTASSAPDTPFLARARPPRRMRP
jgi:hypothetical protein